MKRCILALMVVMLILLTACSNHPTEITNNLMKYAEPVDQLTIPDGVQIIALGEATHSNAEFQAVRLDVLKTLVEKYGVRTIVLEEDFASSELMNRFLSGEDIKLQDVWKDWFPFYHTQEMASLFNWMREYNQSVADEEQLQYWGMDVQRLFLITPFLEKYLKDVDSDLYKEFSGLFVNADMMMQSIYQLASDMTESDYIKAQKTWSSKLQNEVRRIEQLIHKMSNNADHLISKSSKLSYEVAIQNAHSIYNIYSLTNDSWLKDYTEGYNFLYFISRSNNRDAAMKEKVDWILNQVDGPILILGHNGHISKKMNLGEYMSKTALESGISIQNDLLETVYVGERLRNDYGDAYYAIGTSFSEGVLASELLIMTSDNPPTITVRSDNILLDSFTHLQEDVYFLDFDRAKQDKQLKRLLTKEKLKMPHIGSLNSIDLDDPNNRHVDDYILEFNLDETYDAMINFRKANLFTPYMQ